MTEQQTFVYETALQLLDGLTPDSEAKWGVMGPQHMLEHVSGIIYISLGKKELPILTPPEKIAKRRAWLLSDQPFMRNFRVSAFPTDKPMPLRFESFEEAKNMLVKTIDKFKQHYETHPESVVNHPVIGPLNKSEWERFHHKHLVHHFTQFGLLEDDVNTD